MRLPALRAEVWEGFVFTTYDPGLPPLAERLARLSERLAHFRLAELRAPEPLSFTDYPVNWKLFDVTAPNFAVIFVCPNPAPVATPLPEIGTLCKRRTGRL